MLVKAILKTCLHQWQAGHAFFENLFNRETLKLIWNLLAQIFLEEGIYPFPGVFGGDGAISVRIAVAEEGVT